MLVESIGKNRRDKVVDVEMFIKELEKGRSIIRKHILTV